MVQYMYVMFNYLILCVLMLNKVWDYERRTTVARFQEGDTNYITFIPLSERFLLAATSEASIRYTRHSFQ